MNILIVDDHAILRSGLKQIFSEYGEFGHLGEAANGQEVMECLKTGSWDVVLLDLNLPDVNGLEVLHRIKSRWPQVAVLVLSMHGEDQYALRALKAGASGYLTKGCDPAELLTALRTVKQGENYITPSLAQKLAVSLTSPGTRLPHERLSEREFQIFCLLAAGLRNADIGKRLALSEKTVSTHRNRIMDKMKLKNLAELIYYAMEHGFIDRPLGLDNDTAEQEGA
ncbi:MAG TPA: response regulator transcription factor [Gammaproteobacteria bacterium]|nr:response regulator transcription factor [Gammaproteobacteria bacterium]